MVEEWEERLSYLRALCEGNLSPFQKAVLSGEVGIDDPLHDDSGDAALHAAAANNLWGSAKALLIMGADAARSNQMGKTPSDR